MNIEERCYFAERAKKMRNDNPDIKYFSMTVFKQNVKEHIRVDGNKLYNYMIGLLLLEEMALNSKINFIPDPRSLKVESGNSMSDYLQTKLWFDYNSTTTLDTNPCDSASNKNVQFSDMLSGVTQGHYEDNNSKPWQILASVINSRRLYFNA